MFASHLSVRKVPAVLLGLSAIFAFSVPLLLTACGGGFFGGAAQGKWTWMGGSNTVPSTCSPASLIQSGVPPALPGRQ